jgi:BirA family biotin operon repressor/biotin-[acetyl-CoA-carboxylase] ligase
MNPGPSAAALPRGSALLALAAGVAVADALTPLLPAQTVGLRWPNDVVAGGRKLAGVLVEVLGDGRSIVGIGVNTNNTALDAPAEIRARVGTLRDLTARTHDQTDVLAAILQELKRCLAAVGSAPVELAARADALCGDRGQWLRVECSSEVVSGRCLGIAADGALLLETAAGRRAIYSGTIRLPENAGSA